MNDETFLVTGAMGCIGAWVLRDLVTEGTRVVAADLATDPVRPRLLLSEPELAQVTFARLDITDLKSVQELVSHQGITHVVHLAGLQVPFCRANPSLGAQVNVVGTVNIFEAARQHWGQVQGVAYASSIAVLGPIAHYTQRPIGDDAPLHPETLYGVYKQADEGVARLYWQDWRIGSVGLRPYIVYGAGRDQGMTSDIAKAILAAVAGRPFQIQFDGLVALQYAADVARMFIQAARAGHQGAAACNLRNDVVTVAEFVAALKSAFPGVQVGHAVGKPLPFPAELDDGGLRRILGEIPHTPLAAAIQQSAGLFRDLLDKGLVDLKQLED